MAFGGVSPEHEVSVISTLQAAAELDASRYRAVPLYAAKDGIWYGGDMLLQSEAYQNLDELRERAERVRIVPGAFGKLELEIGAARAFSSPKRRVVDVLFLGFHGGDGENGGMQGLCEMLNVPYTGSGVFGSALGMDKVHSKFICRDQQIPIVEFVDIREPEWAGSEQQWLDQCERRVGYPAVVKPARLGSSIGISRCADRKALDDSIEDAFCYDDKIVIERAVQRLREVNCSVLGDARHAVPSVLEEPVRTRDESTLTFEDKYLRGNQGSGKARRRGAKATSVPGGMASLDRIIPAQLSDLRTREIQDLAVHIFRLFECSGVARLDFLIDEDTDRVFFNEINTIPGSFSFYLWDKSGISFRELTSRLIEIALERHRQKNGRVRSFETNLLSLKSLQGLKGAKAERV